MPRQSFDLRLAETKHTYRSVPFSTITDWIQTGRLLEDDEVSPLGKESWQRLDKHSLFLPYFVQPQTPQANDVAEALESVHFDIAPRRPEEEDDDVDMIPMIDISLVLLIFFLMTAGSLLTLQPIRTPEAEYGKVFEPGPRLVIGMTYDLGIPQYFLGEDNLQPMPLEQLLDAVSAQLGQEPERSEVLLRANPEIPFDLVQQLTIELQKRGVKRILPSVAEKSPPKENP